MQSYNLEALFLFFSSDIDEINLDKNISANY
jgi:hypothetical protein